LTNLTSSKLSTAGTGVLQKSFTLNYHLRTCAPNKCNFISNKLKLFTVALELFFFWEMLQMLVFVIEKYVLLVRIDFDATSTTLATKYGILFPTNTHANIVNGCETH
jgi:hypothetical protein